MNGIFVPVLVELTSDDRPCLADLFDHAGHHVLHFHGIFHVLDLHNALRIAAAGQCDRAGTADLLSERAVKANIRHAVQQELIVMRIEETALAVQAILALEK